MHRLHQGRFGEHALFADSHAHPSPAPPRASTGQWSAASGHAPEPAGLSVRRPRGATLLHPGRRSRALRQTLGGPGRVNLTTTALRAGIYDRNGQILAVSRPTSLVIADDIQIKHPLREAQAMSPIIQIPVSRLVALLSKSKDGYVILNDKLNLNSGRKLAASGLSRGRRAELVRAHLSQRTTGDVGARRHERRRRRLGRTRIRVSKTLRGQHGYHARIRLLLRRQLPSSFSTVIRKAQPGVGLELTLDTSLQFVAERDLARQLAATDAVSGVAVVMDVKTGEILADASLANTKSHPGVLGTDPVGVEVSESPASSRPSTTSPSPRPTSRDRSSRSSRFRRRCRPD
jgi:hypothetical protein